MKDRAWILLAVRQALSLERFGRLSPESVGTRATSKPVIEPAECSDMLGQIRRHRLIGLLARHATALELPAELASSLHRAHQHEVGRGLAAVAATRRTSRALHDADIPHLVVKGVALAAVVTGDPTARGGGDIDIWVPAGSLPTVRSVLTSLGFHVRPSSGRPAPTERSRAWRPYLFAVHEQAWDRVGDTAFMSETVDAHWRLAHRQSVVGYEFPEALARSIAVPVVGSTVRTLCPSDALTHVVEHGRKEAFPTLRSLVDIVRLVDACGVETVRTLAVGRSERARNLRLGLAVAATIAPDLAEIVPLTRTRRRLANLALEGSLSLQLGGGVRRHLDLRQRLAIASRQHGWAVLSSPGPISALTYVLQTTIGIVGFGLTSFMATTKVGPQE